MGAGRFPPGAYLSLAIPRRAVDPPDGRQRYDFTVVGDYSTGCLFPSGVPRQEEAAAGARAVSTQRRPRFVDANHAGRRVGRPLSVLGAEEGPCPPAPPRVRAPSSAIRRRSAGSITTGGSSDR